MKSPTPKIRFKKIYGVDFGWKYAFQAQNADIETRLKYFYGSEVDDHMHFAYIDENGVVIALAALQQNPYDDSELWFMYITVDPNYRGKGYGKNLFMKAVAFAESKSKTLHLSILSECGRLHLSRTIQAVQRSHPGLLTRIPEDLIVE